MSEATRPSIDVEGAAAPPRRNGELVFQEPWEGRAFGMAVTLGDARLFPWEAFRRRLIAAIAEGGPSYYENWLAALETLLVESGVLSAAEIETRLREFATGERDIVHPGAA